MILRPATLADAPILLAWRNDPLTRAMSVTAGEVRPEEHRAWLAASLASGARLLLIAMVEDAPAGVVRLDFGEETELSWTVAPEHRGRGLGRRMVRAAAPPGAVAWIKRANRASQRLAAAAGFTLAHDAELQRWVRSAAASRAA